MITPCSIIGEPGTKIEATMAIMCGTLGVGPLEIRSLEWFAVRCPPCPAGCWMLDAVPFDMLSSGYSVSLSPLESNFCRIALRFKDSHDMIAMTSFAFKYELFFCCLDLCFSRLLAIRGQDSVTLQPSVRKALLSPSHGSALRRTQTTRFYQIAFVRSLHTRSITVRLIYHSISVCFFYLSTLLLS